MENYSMPIKKLGRIKDECTCFTSFYMRLHVETNKANNYLFNFKEIFQVF